MPRSDGYFRPGVSGNPKGRPPRKDSMRDAVRRVLDKPDSEGSDRSRLEAWAEELVTTATTFDDRMKVLTWLEGASPSANNMALREIGLMLDEIEAGIGNQLKVVVEYVDAPHFDGDPDPAIEFDGSYEP